ncbi:10933_t:CDS:2 [Cetraspora pellucida]|uniref:10933_t:CDS:1 n=1 Tax=Cetraspora pellucida TaxID=1433469 RepID=A0A9N9H7I9_9GLOM|nr:10933_t:CDS:2 [Cetraspora pellucida]
MLNLLGKIYKNEPKSLLIFRLLVIVTSIGLFIAILVVLSIEMHNENPNISTAFATTNRLPLPNIYFSHERNFTIECYLTNNTDTEQTVNDCSNYINKTIYDASQLPLPYSGAFLPNYDVTPRTGIIMIELSIFIMDPAYNKSNQNNSLFMSAFDKDKINDLEYDPYFRDPSTLTFTPFEESLYWKNIYYLSQPISERLGLISPWGFAQRLKPFRNQYEKNLLPFTMDSQSDELDTEEKSDIKEDENALILKRLDNLEKSLQFYKEYVLDTSFLPSVKKNASLAIEK